MVLLGPRDQSLARLAGERVESSTVEEAFVTVRTTRGTQDCYERPLRDQLWSMAGSRICAKSFVEKGLHLGVLGLIEPPFYSGKEVFPQAAGGEVVERGPQRRRVRLQHRR